MLEDWVQRCIDASRARDVACACGFHTEDSMSRHNRSAAVGDTALALVVGGAAGGLIAFAVWKVASRAIDKQLAEGGKALLRSAESQLRTEATAVIRREVPEQVRTQMTATLRNFGLTPETGRQIATVLNYADRVGII